MSFSARIFLAPLFLEPPDLPHDFYAYIGGAKCILSGGALYSGDSRAMCQNLYGPALSYLFAGMLLLFGENFLLLKLPAILFESFGIVLFFYIAQQLFSDKTARHLSLLYAFSYFTLISSGAKGNDDSIFMFFIILGVYLLIKGRLTLSASSIGVAAAFKVVALIMLPALLLYLYRKHTSWKLVKYSTVVAAVLLIFFVPVLSNAESDVSWYLFGNAVPTKTNQMPAHLGVFNLIRIIHRATTYLVYGGISDQSSFIVLLNSIIPTVTTAALLGVFGYMLFFGIKNAAVELMRNMFLLPLTITLSGSLATPDYLLWFLPFVFLLSGGLLKANVTKLNKKTERTGILLLLAGVILFSAFYRETDAISNYLRVLLWFVVILTTIGTYYSLDRFPPILRRALTGVVFASSLFDIDLSAPLLVFKSTLEQLLPHELVNRQIVVAFMGKQYYSSPVDDFLFLSFFVPILVIFLISLASLPLFFHKTFRKEKVMHSPITIIKEFLGGIYKPRPD